MNQQSCAHAALTTFLALVTSTTGSAQSPAPHSDPAKGFDPRMIADRPARAANAASEASRVNPASSIFLLPQHGNLTGGVDRGYSNAGVVFGARIVSNNLAMGIELFYYLPSGADNFYRDGDYRASTGLLGGANGTDNGNYFCPQGYAAVGLQGAAGLGVDRVGLICGQIGNLSKVVALPVFGGKGGNAFADNCASTPSLGFLTGVRIRSGAWMDSIQGYCQAAGAGGNPETSKAKPATSKLTDDRAASIAVGAERSEVLQKLGEPYSKLSGDFERFTYQLKSGGTLKIELEGGRVTKVQTTAGAQ